MPHVPIILFTGYGEELLRTKAEKVGIRKVLPKTRADELVDSIGELLKT